MGFFCKIIEALKIQIDLENFQAQKSLNLSLPTVMGSDTVMEQWKPDEESNASSASRYWLPPPPKVNGEPTHRVQGRDGEIVRRDYQNLHFNSMWIWTKGHLCTLSSFLSLVLSKAIFADPWSNYWVKKIAVPKTRIHFLLQKSKNIINSGAL